MSSNSSSRRETAKKVNERIVEIVIVNHCYSSNSKKLLWACGPSTLSIAAGFTAVNCKVCDSLCWLVGRAHEQNEYVFSFSRSLESRQNSRTDDNEMK